MVVSLVTKEKDGVPYLGLEVESSGYYLVESQDDTPSCHTIRSEDGEVDITVHICELTTYKGHPVIQIVVVANFVGWGIKTMQRLSKPCVANRDLNWMIDDLIWGD
jgi:hypothetical protein